VSGRTSGGVAVSCWRGHGREKICYTAGMTRTRTFIASLALVVPGLLVAGCGSDSKDSSSSATTVVATTAAAPTTTAAAGGKEAVCAARSTLGTSIQGLKNLDVSKGVAGIKAAFEQIRLDAQAFADAARTDYKPEATALQTSIDQLKTALDAVGNGTPAATLTGLTTAAAGLQASASALFAKVQADCPTQPGY
jgi:hypothetical protein